MKIDAHQHFWHYNTKEYGWIDNRMIVLKRNYLPPDLLPELAGAGFDGTVVVQARQTVNETRWLLQLAGRYDFIRGVVGWVDLCSGNELRRQLDEFTRSGKLVGIRHVVHDEPDKNFMLRDPFLEGIGVLNEYNLTYDLLLFPEHLPVARSVVSMFPRQRFVLDHIAKPLIRDQVIDPWAEDIKRIAEHENVWCKISGMVTEADWKRQKQSDFIPYLDVVFKVFGTGRIMTGSDWPVCLLAGDYKYVTGILNNYISDMPAPVRERILGMNCVDFYGLDML